MPHSFSTFFDTHLTLYNYYQPGLSLMYRILGGGGGGGGGVDLEPSINHKIDLPRCRVADLEFQTGNFDLSQSPR